MMVRLSVSFDGKLRYKIKDDLYALSKPIRFSSDKNDSVSRLMTTFLEKLDCCLSALSKFLILAPLTPIIPLAGL